MENNMVDISSDSKQKKQKFSFLKNDGFNSLGIIIKVISLIVALGILAIHIVAAYLLFAFKPIYTTISIAIILVGLLVSLIVLFLIYALGHCISQNNEILKTLKK